MEAVKIRKNRQYRSFEVRAGEVVNNGEMWVEGYAVIFNSPTVLFSDEGIDYCEQIDARAFDNANMDDVIFNYNHTGHVMARIKNGTLELKIDEKGLFIRARLDGTQEGQEIYRNIKDGYIDKMSFQFTIANDIYDRANHLDTICIVTGKQIGRAHV